MDLTRPNTLYVTWQTHKSLQYIAGAMGIPADELAETILAEHIKAKYPHIVAHIKTRWDQDKAFKEQLQRDLNQGTNLT